LHRKNPALAEFFFEDLILGAEVLGDFLFGGCFSRPGWRSGVARAGGRSS